VGTRAISCPEPVASASLLEEGEKPLSLPGLDGDWPLDPIRWQVLRAALSTTVCSPGLVGTISRATGEFRTAELSRQHEVEGFDCGVEKLNDRLRRAAESLGNEHEQHRSSSQARVCLAGDVVTAYISFRTARIHCPSRPHDGSLELIYVPSLAVDLRWRGSAVAQALVGSLVQDVQNDTHGRLLGVLGVAISPGIRELFRRFGARPIGDVIHPQGVVITRADADISDLHTG
jgi:hypothetical protein